MKEKALILLTNDDGIEARGLKALQECASGFGDLVIISSAYPKSGMSHAITIREPLRVMLLQDEPGLKVYRTNGTPVDGVKLALHKLLPRKPDLLLSGINHGTNSSSSILYSGTMGAALEGAIHHVPSVGLSLLDHSAAADFEGSKQVGRELIADVLEQGLPKGICLNVNIPAVPAAELKGIRLCTQANGYWQEEFEERKDPAGGSYYWLSGFFRNRDGEDGLEGSDEWALKRNYVSVVPVDTDFTAKHLLQGLEKRFSFSPAKAMEQ